MQIRSCRSRLAARCLFGLFAFLSITAGTATAFPLDEAAGEMTDAEAQAKTVEDMLDVGTAMFSWLIDQVGDAAAAENKSIVNLDLYPRISHNELASILIPQYIQSIPERDGWGNRYEFFLNRDDILASQVMGIRSPGRDGQSSGNAYTIGLFDPWSFDEDIVWVDGFFARRPRTPLTDAEAQAQTLSDMLNVGTAMFNWLVDQVADSASDPAAGTPTSVDMNDYPLIKRKRLSSLLVPQYIASLPEADGWGNPYELYLNTEDPLAPQVMAIRSAGRDGLFSGSIYIVGGFDPESFDEDIVWVDGFFARRPEKASAHETK